AHRTTRSAPYSYRRVCFVVFLPILFLLLSSISAARMDKSAVLLSSAFHFCNSRSNLSPLPPSIDCLSPLSDPPVHPAPLAGVSRFRSPSRFDSHACSSSPDSARSGPAQLPPSPLLLMSATPSPRR